VSRIEITGGREAVSGKYLHANPEFAREILLLLEKPTQKMLFFLTNLCSENIVDKTILDRNHALRTKRDLLKSPNWSSAFGLPYNHREAIGKRINAGHIIPKARVRQRNGDYGEKESVIAS
jgi:hypothetical protein